VEVGRKERHQITGKVKKALKKAADSQRNAKKTEKITNGRMVKSQHQ
jgi:hypothetical protein